MGDFREVFDIGRLDEQQLGSLEYILASPAYTDVFLPYLQSMTESLNNRLLDRSSERRQEYPDDFLAGGIVMARGFIEFFNRIISETQVDRVIRSQQMTDEERYARAAAAGKHVPVLGANEPLEVEPAAYDPAEDY